MTLTREEILGPPDFKTVDVDPLGEMNLREVTGSQFDYIRGNGVEVDERGLFARVAISVVCDSDGKLIFNKNDFEKVNAMPVRRLQAIADAAKEHCGLWDEPDEDVEGN